MIKTRKLLNAKATAATTQREKDFLKVPNEGRLRLRFLPPTTDNGSLFRLVAQHFNFKEDDRGTALACLEVYGGPGAKCPVCQVVATLDRNKKTDKELIEKIKRSDNQVAPVFQIEFDSEGKLITPTKIKLGQFTPPCARSIQAEIDDKTEDGKLTFTGDVDGKGGYDITIIRSGQKAQTSYKIKAHDRSDLDTVVPNWEELYDAYDVDEKIGLKIRTYDEIVELLKENYEDSIDLAMFAVEE